jgi:alcohol dehydrogenase class IV
MARKKKIAKEMREISRKGERAILCRHALSKLTHQPTKERFFMYKLFCRTFQKGFWIGSNFLPWRRPVRLCGYGGLVDLLNDKGCKSVLLVTDKGVMSAGLHLELMAALQQAGVRCTIFDKTVQNPTCDNIEDALTLYRWNNCTGIIALGGGSAIDCAKGVGARIARPKRAIPEMKGLFKVILPMPLFIAIPTTSGSGSETTVASIITDPRRRKKYAIMDIALIPHYTLLMPEITRGLPPFFTATTGMDALCHAVEAYIGQGNTKQTRADALKAARLIFSSIYRAYIDGEDLNARANMQQAAYLAGAAFTRAYVGNIHAISHTLSGQYGIPHGLANAVIMPYVLRIYGKAAHRPLWELACAVGLAGATTPISVGAARFIDAICELNAKMGIPEKLAGLKTKDFPMLAARALKEANPLYPVPVIFDKGDVTVVLLKVMT